MSRLPIEDSLETIIEPAGGHYAMTTRLFLKYQSETVLYTTITMVTDSNLTFYWYIFPWVLIEIIDLTDKFIYCFD